MQSARNGWHKLLKDSHSLVSINQARRKKNLSKIKSDKTWKTFLVSREAVKVQVSYTMNIANKNWKIIIVISSSSSFDRVRSNKSGFNGSVKLPAFFSVLQKLQQPAKIAVWLPRKRRLLTQNTFFKRGIIRSHLFLNTFWKKKHEKQSKWR